MNEPGLGPLVDALKQQVDEHGFIDIGAGVVKDLPVSETEFKVALSALKNEGYQVHFMKIEQLPTGETAHFKVLVGPNVTREETFANRRDIRLPDFT